MSGRTWHTARTASSVWVRNPSPHSGHRPRTHPARLRIDGFIPETEFIEDIVLRLVAEIDTQVLAFLPHHIAGELTEAVDHKTHLGAVLQGLEQPYLGADRRDTEHPALGDPPGGMDPAGPEHRGRGEIPILGRMIST